MSYSPHRRRKGEEDAVVSSSTFSSALLRTPPPVPPALLRRIGGKEVTGVGKVKVMLKVTGKHEDSPCFKVDRRHKQVTLTDPSTNTATTAPQERRVGVAAPKMFAFDAIFTEEDSQIDINTAALVDILHAVINGSDGCILCFGHAKLGKTQTMLGCSDGSLGVIPSAISWLFKGIHEQKVKTGSRFSVRVSAIEVSTTMKDLLIGHANDCEQSPGVYLREEVQNYSELRVPSAEKAAYYLDSAVNGRSTHAHFLFTMHIYQYNVASKGAVAGGRSRLHLIDLGTCDRTKGGAGPNLSGVSNVLLAIFNGQRHPPHREYKLTQVLKDCLSSLTCHVTLLAHVSPTCNNYSETLGTVQLAARIHRIRRRRVKFGNSAATQVAGEDLGRLTGSSDVDPSSSEQSADTVIYVGRSEETDGEHPPVYIPSLTSGDNRCAMGKALRGTGMENRDGKDSRSLLGGKQSTSRSMPCSPQKLLTDPSMNQDKVPKTSLHSKQLGSNSVKSSPIKINHLKETKYNEPKQLEERWVDGPKIAKSKVVEARQLNMLHKSRQHLLSKKETWVDGPLKSNHDQGYGFMDYHKKSMIKKWLENQSILHHHRHKSSCGKDKNSRGYITRFKTSGLERRTDGEGKSKSSSGSSREETHRTSKPLMDLRDDAYERFKASRGQASGQEDGDGDDDVEVVAPLTQTTVVTHNGEMSRVVPVQRLQECEGIEDVEDDDIEVEIVEVEECEESVPMQDCCLQVTEEDIALCMGQTENPLPEVDQTDQTLKLMNQGNITFVSTVTDSVTVAYDFERLITQRVQNHTDGSPWLTNRNRAPLLQNSRGMVDYSQLSRLSMSGALDSTCRELENRPLARCQSLSLTDMLGVSPSTEQLSDYDNNSIVSEPAYIMGEDQLSDKLCEKCRLRFNSGDFYETPLYANLRSLSALRHPDGASNPNLKQAGEKDTEKENVTPRKAEEDSDEDPTVPPPLHGNLLTLNRETFSRTKGSNMTGGSGNQSQFRVHDPGGTGLQYCKADLERLERGWSEAQRLRDPRTGRTPLLTPNSRWHPERQEELQHWSG